MNHLQPHAARADNAKGALYLQFRIGEQRFALSVHEVIEVLPRQPLKPIAQAPGWVAGILSHRGQLVPVIDLAALSFGQPAAHRTSTRLVLVHYRGGLQLGLILEQATETLRCHPDEFQPYGVDSGEAPYLGPVRQDDQGLLQRIEVNDLLSDAVHQLLYTVEPAGMPT
ncbi:purine-binding chemotaxis protein CheW [Pseudomonas monteilii]|uniref:chemotaxis protein CheW n=1 Tax=Pseudomonas monteilii TaxID=76759 RepID=UPI0015E3F190|nr:chemotaxis protein CheW [Pseudomonas monteilii]MBA1317355.1 purine-binding chemotaxis protein CheW [Pseudomonas monteilii]